MCAKPALGVIWLRMAAAHHALPGLETNLEGRSPFMQQREVEIVNPLGLGSDENERSPG